MQAQFASKYFDFGPQQATFAELLATCARLRMPEHWVFYPPLHKYCCSCHIATFIDSWQLTLALLYLGKLWL